jgi:glucuronate isomerase
MSRELRERLFAELDAIRLIDPHSHIQPLQPASTTLADILGYHYYTELAHSAGMPRERIEQAGLSPREKVGRLIEWLPVLDNTVQVSWLTELCQRFFGLAESTITTSNWQSLFDASAVIMAQPDWSRRVLELSNVQAVFLTNDFDDPLEGFDTRVFVPCLRTDELVFHLAKQTVRERLERTTQISIQSSSDLHAAIGKIFERFVKKNAKACAISLPPDFTPSRPEVVDDAVHKWLTKKEGFDAESGRHLSHFVFWTLAEFCGVFKLPFDLMIGVNRQVYSEGVLQGQDLYDSRVSLIQYRELLNAFPQVTFPISVLASVTNQELTSYAWIYPNVVTSGHWWYSNTPSFIERDLAARLEAVPRTKQIGYYSDAYKLEFILPKFAMYKRILAKVLAERFVIDRAWSEERAVELGHQVLRGNIERVFGIQ